MEDIEKFLQIVKNGKNIVFFGGAGVSTESGIPDFRGTGGLYHQKYAYPPEEILSDTFFWSKTDEFFRFYRDKMLFHGAKPNVTHKTLALLEQKGKLKAVVTQNIDDLHEQAGSKNVLHLHGSVYGNTCVRCGKRYGIEAVENSAGVPYCDCGAFIKPDVVLYGEPLPQEVVAAAVDAISHADVLIVGGTSLTVYPAAMYVDYFRGEHLILINKESTPLDGTAELTFHCKLGEVFQKLFESIS